MKSGQANFLLAGIITLMIMQGCKKANYNNLEDSQIKWLIYNKGERLIFKSTGTLADTFIVDNRVRGYSGDKYHYNEVASITFHDFSDTLTQATNGSITVSKDDDNKFIASYLFPHFPIRVYLTAMDPVPIDTINGVPVENVYISASDSSTYSLTNHVRKVYFTRENGFIKYDDIYGHSWYKVN